MIDRITPTTRPAGSNAGTQSWRSLLFCHWEVSVDSLRELVPAALSIDTYQGRAFVGLVPFRMNAVRPSWLPRRLAFHFLETNVRTYVVHQDRPGVYFFSLDASSRLAVTAARSGWSLPYYYARMSATEQNGLHIYRSQRPAHGAESSVAFRIANELGVSQPGTLEHFLLERYLLFVERKKQIYMGQVHHTPYPTHTAMVEEFHDNLISAAGLPAVNHCPEIAHYSTGVDVEVFAIKRV
jgi:uncharacterized protein YqjF (DUF2071 family)